MVQFSLSLPDEVYAALTKVASYSGSEPEAFVEALIESSVESKPCCNVCGKEFDTWDESENFVVHSRLGYGTKFDGDELNLHICCKCMESIIDSCKVSPITEND